jgi:hypothetical protein
MKVYIVISYVDYECCHNVGGAFDTIEKAELFAKDNPAFGPENYDIVEQKIE